MWRERMHRALSMPRLYRNWPTALRQRFLPSNPGNDTVRYHLRDGTTLDLRSGRMGVWIVNEIWIERVYERIPAFMPHSGWIVIDAGANQGVYSARAAASGATVFAIEPEPNNARLLRANAANVQHGRIDVREAALTPTGEPVRLHIAAGNEGGHATSPESGVRYASSIQVSGLTLADAVACAGDRVHLLKLDVEGAEFGLFDADPAAWQAIRRVVMEYHRHGDLSIKDSREVAVSKLTALGYTSVVEAVPRILYASR